MGDKAEKRERKKSDGKKKKKTSKKEEKKNKCTTGQIVVGHKGTAYVVECLLGAGGFGEVYKVHLKAEPMYKYALKVETSVVKRKSDATLLRLKVEIAVFDAIETARNESAIDCSHFVNMIDKGKTLTYKYYVMDLIWKSLGDCVDDIVKLKGKLSPSTLIQIARQTLKGVQAIHQLGFLHRDIKPVNYAIGLAPKDTVIYLLDFGICRPYRDKNGEVRGARKRAPGIGTRRYASINCQTEKEQGRGDDLQTWVYMMLELYDKSNLSWYSFPSSEIDLIVKRKLELMTDPKRLHAQGKLRMPVQYCDIISAIWSMQYKDEGNFFVLNDILRSIVVAEKINDTLPLDWAGKAPRGPPEKPRVKKDNKGSKKSTAEEGPSIDEALMKQKDKKRRSKDREKTREKEEEDEEDEYWREDEEDEDGDSLQGDSDEDEEGEYRRKKRKRSKKKRTRERTRTRTRDDYSDRDRDDRRRRPRSIQGKKRKSRKSKVSKRSRADVDDEKIARIPDPVTPSDEKGGKTPNTPSTNDGQTPEKTPDPKTPVKKSDDAPKKETADNNRK